METNYEKVRVLKQGTIEITRVGILGLQVCTDVKDMEVLTKTVNEMHTCGTTNGWVLDNREEVHPVACEKHSTRKHIVFTC